MGCWANGRAGQVSAPVSGRAGARVGTRFFLHCLSCPLALLTTVGFLPEPPPPPPTPSCPPSTPSTQVMITFLQHTHPKLPHYGDGEWDWLRGAMATVDRSYGVLDHVFHHIAGGGRRGFARGGRGGSG